MWLALLSLSLKRRCAHPFWSEKSGIFAWVNRFRFLVLPFGFICVVVLLIGVWRETFATLSENAWLIHIVNFHFTYFFVNYKKCLTGREQWFNLVSDRATDNDFTTKEP